MMNLLSGNIKKYNKTKIFLFLLSMFSIVNVVVISTIHHDLVRIDYKSNNYLSNIPCHNGVPAKKHDPKNCLKCQLVDNVVRVAYLVFCYDNIENSGFFHELNSYFKVSYTPINKKSPRAPPIS